jgi:hypothetical protein
LVVQIYHIFIFKILNFKPNEALNPETIRMEVEIKIMNFFYLFAREIFYFYISNIFLNTNQKARNVLLYFQTIEKDD